MRRPDRDGRRRRRERCVPSAVVVPPRMSAYSEASKAVFEVFEDTAPIGRRPVDRRGVSGRPRARAHHRARRSRSRRGCGARSASEVGLPITVGVARTKFLAKVASAVAKPDGLLLVPPDRELEFLHPLPVERLWGVGKVTAEKLTRRGSPPSARSRARPRRRSSRLLGRASGRHLHALAHNHDPRPVEARRRRRSIGAQRALGRRRRDAGEFGDGADGARRSRDAAGCGRPRACAGRSCCGCGSRTSRARRARTRCASRRRIRRRSCMTATGLLRASMPMIERRGLTLIGIALTNLMRPGRRPAAAAVRPRAGPRRDRSTACATGSAPGAITRGALVGQDPGVVVPLLPRRATNDAMTTELARAAGRRACGRRRGRRRHRRAAACGRVRGC